MPGGTKLDVPFSFRFSFRVPFSFSTKAISQISGEGLRVRVTAFLRAMTPGGTLDRLVRRYPAYSLWYANQAIACNLLHSEEERICRWLLMCHDRVGKDVFTLTHELLAEMLGVRRQTASGIAGMLQTAGIITLTLRRSPRGVN